MKALAKRVVKHHYASYLDDGTYGQLEALENIKKNVAHLLDCTFYLHNGKDAQVSPLSSF